MKITVIGCGRWGSLITWYLAGKGHEVALYGRETSAHMQQFLATRQNDLLTLPASVCLSTDLTKALEGAKTVILSVPSQSLRALLKEAPLRALKNPSFVLCMKGLEIESGKRLSEVVHEELPEGRVAVWLGPGHVQEFYAGIPNCMVIDSADKAFQRELISAFSGDLIRFYYGQDLLGNEIGAALKNVIGIAAGFLDGLSLTTLKGPLMSRGTAEVARLIKAMGGDPLSAYGLCHLGDYEATVFSPYSHNRTFGENYIKGIPYTALAEGYYTVRALRVLEIQYHMEMPICDSVYRVLYENAVPREEIDRLFGRSLKPEFYDRIREEKA